MKCKGKGCNRSAVSRGLCGAHYWRFQKYGNPDVLTRPRYDGVVCKAEGCKKDAYCKGFCHEHYRKFRLYGDPLISKKAPNGAGYRRKDGYEVFKKNGKIISGHVLIAEKALGRKLPKKSEVHHFNEDKTDNRNENLVICPSSAYHNLLHRRADALKECGNANWLRCQYCKQYDSPENITTINGEKREFWYHKDCRAEYRSALWRRNH